MRFGHFTKDYEFYSVITDNMLLFGVKAFVNVCKCCGFSSNLVEMFKLYITSCLVY